MKNNPKRPIFQAVFKYRYPIMAIASGLHRISGIVLFLLIPVLLCALHKSLISADSFQQVKNALDNPIAITIVWISLAALIYHFFAGIRHLLMDAGFGDSLKGGKWSAYIVIILTLITLFLIGIFI